tara:strand:+ start:54 stop:1076 length:1023 start_codon:yes stop_codon:yes gene_type:complete
MKTLKYLFFSPIDLLLLIYGIVIYKKFKTNPYFSYKAMLRLFYIYGGFITKLVHRLTNEKKKKVLLNENFDKIEKINKNLTNKGFYQYQNFITQKQIQTINNLIENYEFNLRPTDQDLKNSKHTIKKKFFNSKNPEAVLYEVDTDFLIQQPVIHEILLNNNIYQVAKKYFDSEPFLDHVSLSISSDYNKMTEPDSKAAQLYHFDLDRPKWLKFLIYLNDVDEKNGPHCYVEGTHKINGIPFNIRSRGYKRIEDYKIQRLNLDQHTFHGKAGSAIIEDTIGLHKGSVVKSGYRILLNIQVNSSMFGIPYKKIPIKKIKDSVYKNFKDRGDFFKYTVDIKTQ